MSLRSRFHPRAGFTLLELLVVIAIISVLAAMSLSAYMGVKCTGKEAVAQATIRDLETALFKYQSDFAAFPADMGSSGANANKNQSMVFALARPGARGVPYYDFRRTLQGNLTGGPPAAYVSDLVAAGNNDPTAYPCFYSPLAQFSLPSTAHLYQFFYRENTSEPSKAGLFNLHSFDLWTAGCVETASGPTEDVRFGGRTTPQNSRINNWR